MIRIVTFCNFRYEFHKLARSYLIDRYSQSEDIVTDSKEPRKEFDELWEQYNPKPTSHEKGVRIQGDTEHVYADPVSDKKRFEVAGALGKKVEELGEELIGRLIIRGKLKNPSLASNIRRIDNNNIKILLRFWTAMRGDEKKIRLSPEQRQTVAAYLLNKMRDNTFHAPHWTIDSLPYVTKASEIDLLLAWVEESIEDQAYGYNQQDVLKLVIKIPVKDETGLHEVLEKYMQPDTHELFPQLV